MENPVLGRKIIYITLAIHIIPFLKLLDYQTAKDKQSVRVSWIDGQKLNHPAFRPFTDSPPGKPYYIGGVNHPVFLKESLSPYYLSKSLKIINR